MNLNGHTKTYPGNPVFRLTFPLLALLTSLFMFVAAGCSKSSGPNCADMEEICDGVDNNCDGVVDEGFDLDADGQTSCAGDCDDNNASVGSGYDELCDGLDNDCDELVDEGFDEDLDGSTLCGPDGIPGTGDDDCDDYAALVHPGAEEVCDDLDNNCDGVVDEGFDLDSDGQSSCAGDCDDNNATVGTGYDELCDGLDNDCDGAVDEGFDTDLDGVTRCGPDGILGTEDDDCDDFAAGVQPGAQEVCDGLDNNCDGVVDEGFDVDLDGQSSCAGDCDDSDPARGLGFDELCDGLDNDCDSVVDEGFDADLDGVTRCGPDGVLGSADDDCNDLQASVNPGAAEICDGLDNNCDAVVDEGFDVDGDGQTSCAGDCDDNNAAVGPGHDELCDGLDNDCDSVVDEGFDKDLDGVTVCGADGALGTADDDCNDLLASVAPGASEICDDLDNNCNGSIDEGFDGDSDGQTSCGGDCDDANPSVGSGFEELCDGQDNDCDAVVDEGFDSDLDGVTRCGPDGILGNADDDCDDFNPQHYPGASELCDGIDNDCDGNVPAAELDGDSDGVTPCQGDCDDSSAAISPNLPEIPCNDLDDDCDPGTIDRGDMDADGSDVCDGDCDDTDPAINPLASEQCNGLDDDCDGQIDENFDLDFDGFATCAGDCDDRDPDINPAAADVCDGQDNNCDGAIDEGFGDTDNDGTPDCLDSENSVADCMDGMDNDGDGWADCDDSECVGLGACPFGEICYNGEDDDYDGWSDCSDSDCVSDPSCTCQSSQTLDCTSNTIYYGELLGPDASQSISRYDCDSGYYYDGSEIALDFVAPYDGQFSFRLTHPQASDVDMLFLDGAVGCQSDACVARADRYFMDGEAYDWVASAGESLIIVAEDDFSATGQFVLEVTDCQMAGPELCDDGWDNDFDGATDCVDTDCFADPLCAGSRCDYIGTLSCGSVESVNNMVVGADLWTSYGSCQTFTYSGYEVVWQYTSTLESNVTITVDTPFDAGVFLLADTGSCDPTTDCVDSVDTVYSAGTEVLSVPVSPSTTYFIVVDDYSGTGGEVSVTLECL